MPAHTSAFDVLARDLHRLRIESGDVSYAEIAARILERRIATGSSPVAARIARSTVYDVFRPGRRRVSPNLMQEIVEALGVDGAEAQKWRQRCIDARAKLSATTPLPLGAVYSERRDLLQNPTMVAIIVVACVGMNSVGGQFVKFLGMPLYLDMTGTAVAAVAVGPWFGVLAGVIYHVLAAWFEAGPDGLWFMLVNVTGALVWCYGVRSWRMGRTGPRYFLLNLLVGLACSMVAVPILVIAFGGLWGHPAQGVLVPALEAIGIGLVESVTSTNLLLSFTDKLLSGYLALGVAYALLRSSLGAPPGLAFGAFRSEHIRLMGGA